MTKEIALVDVVEIVDKLKAEEKERCDRFIELNPAFKEERKALQFTYEFALQGVIHELFKIVLGDSNVDDEKGR